MKAIKSKLEVTLPKAYYFSEDIYQREKELIFCREWFCAGRDDQLPDAGDYMVLEVAGESVLVVRKPDGALAAYYNVCRHRGSQLVAQPPSAEGEPQSSAQRHGSFSSGIRCPYHAWTYALDGRLRTAPYLKEEDDFFKEEFSLYPVGLQSWGGFFFLHLTPAEIASPQGDLLAQLSGVPERLQRYPLAELRAARASPTTSRPTGR